MSERGDQLRAQAAAIDAEDALTQAMNASLSAYRDNPNEETKAVYRAAVETLSEARRTARADRTSISFHPDMIRSEGAVS